MHLTNLFNFIVDSSDLLATTSIAFFLTYVIGYFTIQINRKLAINNKEHAKRLEKIAELISAKSEESKLNLIEKIAPKLPEGTTPEQIQNIVNGALINILANSDMNVGHTNHGEGSFIQELVNSYHQQALSQARVQFWFSVGAATVGFVFIIYQSRFFAVGNIESYLRIMPGVIIDVVAALFFRQAEQTRERATALYDRLRSDNQVLRTQVLVESIEDGKMKSAVKALIALHMAGLKLNEADLLAFMNGDTKNTTFHCF